MWIVWSRERAAVIRLSLLRTSGRMPTKTLNTSLRDGALCRYCPAVSSTKAISCSKWARLEDGLVDGGVRRADDGVPVPGDREHDAAVAGVRHHDRTLPGQERPIEHEMDPLAWGD